MKKVYVLTGPEGRVKVGVSVNPDRRAAHFHGISVAHETDLMTSDEAYKVERTAHGLLRESRLFGEWFATSPELAINAVKAAISMISNGDTSLSKKLFRTGSSSEIFGYSGVTGRFSRDELDAIERAAKADDIPQAGLLRKIIADWLRTNGWLKLAKKERT